MFVPSMSDAGPAAILPRPPLPEPLIADARELLPNAVFASNPCRIRFYNQVRPCTPSTMMRQEMCEGAALGHSLQPVYSEKPTATIVSVLPEDLENVL